MHVFYSFKKNIHGHTAGNNRAIYRDFNAVWRADAMVKHSFSIHIHVFFI